MKMEPNTARLERFCGYSIHPISDVEVYIDRPSENAGHGDGSKILINLEIHCAEATVEDVPEDESLGRMEPIIEVWIPVDALSKDGLEEKTVTIRWPYLRERDARHRLYVFEHEDLWALTVQFREVMGNLCAFELSGTARDPNHYSGDKPETTVLVIGSFALPEQHH